MAYQMAAMAVTLNDLEGHLPVAGLFKCNLSNICAAFYTISTDSVLAWFLCICRASGKVWSGLQSKCSSFALLTIPLEFDNDCNSTNCSCYGSLLFCM